MDSTEQTKLVKVKRAKARHHTYSSPLLLTPPALSRPHKQGGAQAGTRRVTVDTSRFTLSSERSQVSAAPAPSAPRGAHAVASSMELMPGLWRRSSCLQPAAAAQSPGNLQTAAPSPEQGRLLGRGAYSHPKICFTTPPTAGTQAPASSRGRRLGSAGLEGPAPPAASPLAGSGGAACPAPLRPRSLLPGRRETPPLPAPPPLTPRPEPSPYPRPSRRKTLASRAFAGSATRGRRRHRRRWNVRSLPPTPASPGKRLAARAPWPPSGECAGATRAQSRRRGRGRTCAGSGPAPLWEVRRQLPPVPLTRASGRGLRQSDSRPRPADASPRCPVRASAPLAGAAYNVRVLCRYLEAPPQGHHS